MTFRSLSTRESALCVAYIVLRRCSSDVSPRRRHIVKLALVADLPVSTLRSDFIQHAAVGFRCWLPFSFFPRAVRFLSLPWTLRYPCRTNVPLRPEHAYLVPNSLNSRNDRRGAAVHFVRASVCACMCVKMLNGSILKPE